MAFRTLDERFDPALELPIKHKTTGTLETYRIEPADIDTGVEVTAMMGIAARAHLQKSDPTPEELAEIIGSDAGQDSLYRRVLGDTYAELKDDGHDYEVIKFVGATACVWITAGAEEAEAFWNGGGKPAPKASRKPADRKPSAKRTRKA